MNRLCNRPIALPTNTGHEMLALMGCVPAVKHSDSHVLFGIKPHHGSSRMKEDEKT
jgi:hypothetical protein